MLGPSALVFRATEASIDDGGHVKAEYTSRKNPDGTRYPVVIIFSEHCVPEEKTLWAEVNIICQWAGDVLDGEHVSSPSLRRGNLSVVMLGQGKEGEGGLRYFVTRLKEFANRLNLTGEDFSREY